MAVQSDIMLGANLFSIGWLMVIIGFIIIFIAVVLMFIGSIRGKEEIQGGGAVLIGPIPIVFGTSKEIVKVMLIVAIAIIIVALIFTLLTVW